MTRDFRQAPAVALLGVFLLNVIGCGVDVDVPKRAPTAAEIKGWSDRRLTAMEKAVRDKDWKLPSRVSGLIRYLRGLEINVTIGPGQEFKNTQEAVQALDTVIVRLEGWYNESRTRREGDSDADRAKLQAILDEAKKVLKNVKVQNPR
ncbi:MAG TPA: hypothetical protein VMZ92_07320 [Planctomycetota bacterium]|nr:hypothetical protein [Planctomycetota bacterium]